MGRDEDPKLIIHCIQKKFRKRECKLKIMWMIVGYDINFDFNHSDLNVKLKILKNEFNVSNQQAITKQLGLEYYDSSILCFGIPVLSKLDRSNNSLVIGHHFFNDRENKEIETYIFSYCSYCLRKNHYVNLPNFTFYTLIVSNYPNSDNYGISPFQHIIYILQKNKYGPIFLKQKTSEIKIKYINVNGDQDDCICKCKKLEDNLKYAFLDPKNPN
ncbi:hypothetical protein RhiirA4_475670 [Rhizophagus irregularis]|uniref:DUF7431 domain-containing protein n=1 Tax=Rhizophagus irregularis TaxID=588596 RepID=A0A2I1HAH5_9GLOM|nr:hypothetical protein RhiirA4_475670 [Rhizophagus irregularis]